MSDALSSPEKSRFAVTHSSTATLLFEISGLRILTDPVFDAPGGYGSVANIPGSRYFNLTGSALSKESILPVDLILLSHDQHYDNLDNEGRTLLPYAQMVLTTQEGAKRLGGNARGLAPWQSISVATPAGSALRITATPCRHGPPFSLPFMGPVIGFFLEWEEQLRGGVYISGDTVYFRGVEEVADRFKTSIAFLHLGAANLKIFGPFKYTFNAEQAARAAMKLKANLVVPVHYEGWSHFQENKSDVDTQFARSGLAQKLLWLPPGQRVQLTV